MTSCVAQNVMTTMLRAMQSARCRLLEDGTVCEKIEQATRIFEGVRLCLTTAHGPPTDMQVFSGMMVTVDSWEHDATIRSSAMDTCMNSWEADMSSPSGYSMFALHVSSLEWNIIDAERAVDHDAEHAARAVAIRSTIDEDYYNDFPLRRQVRSDG